MTTLLTPSETCIVLIGNSFLRPSRKPLSRAADVVDLCRPAFTWSAHVKYNLDHILNQTCDTYILQEQSMFLSKDDYFTRSYSLPFARTIVQRIRDKKPCAKIFLMETWGYMNEFEPMSQRIRRGYSIVANATNTTVIHTQDWFRSHKDMTSLFMPDGRHPSKQTSKAIAILIAKHAKIKIPKRWRTT